MSFLIDTRTGPIQQADGAGDQPLRQDRSGALVIVDAHGRYLESAYRKNVFHAADQAGQTTSAGLATTYVGVVVSNPIGSPVALAILYVSAAQVVIQAALQHTAIGIGYNSGTN